MLDSSVRRDGGGHHLFERQFTQPDDGPADFSLDRLGHLEVRLLLVGRAAAFTAFAPSI
jgi:hypothetical protein